MGFPIESRIKTAASVLQRRNTQIVTLPTQDCTEHTLLAQVQHILQLLQRHIIPVVRGLNTCLSHLVTLLANLLDYWYTKLKVLSVIAEVFKNK